MSEDLKPIASETEEQSATVSEVTVEQPAEATVEQPAQATEDAQPIEDETIDYSNKGLKDILDIFQDLLDGDDVQKLHKHAESLKAAFYKTLRKEKIVAGFQQAGDVSAIADVVAEDTVGVPVEDNASADVETSGKKEDEKVSVNPFAEVERGFKDLYAKYRTIRASYIAEQEKKKEENFEKKQGLIEQIKSLLEKQEDVKTTYPAFRDIQAKWREIGPVAQDKAKSLYESYQHQVEMFYDYVNLNKEFRDLDFRKNLEAKTQLCEKAEALAEEENVVEAFNTLQKLHEEWKELGPVSKEYREEIWDRFRAATSVVNKRHQAYFETMKSDQEENFQKKTALCEKVENMLKEEISDSSQWNNLTKEVEEIQKEWRTIGYASKKNNKTVYERFRQACDAFFTKKRDFYTVFKDQMQENMDKKVKLCEQAEALKDSTDWKKTSEAFIELQKQWKETGPVSRRKSEQIWKRFRAACDEFFNNRDKQASEQANEYSANLAAKKALIEEVSAFQPTGNRDEDFTALKDMQARWNAIGFVPFKMKAKIQAEFKKVIDAQFDAVKGSSSAERGRHRFSDAAGRGEISFRSERDKLVQAYTKKEQEIATWSNNMGFFSKSKNAEALLEELNKKIEIAKQELVDLENQIKEYDRQHEESNEQ